MYDPEHSIGLVHPRNGRRQQIKGGSDRPSYYGTWPKLWDFSEFAKKRGGKIYLNHEIQEYISKNNPIPPVATKRNGDPIPSRVSTRISDNVHDVKGVRDKV